MYCKERAKIKAGQITRPKTNCMKKYYLKIITFYGIKTKNPSKEGLLDLF